MRVSLRRRRDREQASRRAHLDLVLRRAFPEAQYLGRLPPRHLRLEPALPRIESCFGQHDSSATPAAMQVSWPSGLQVLLMMSQPKATLSRNNAFIRCPLKSLPRRMEGAHGQVTRC